MHTVIVSDNPLQEETYSKHEVEHVGMFLHDYFKGSWPETAHIYLGEVAKCNDVTPQDEASIEALESYDQPLVVVVYPATGVEVAVAIGVVALVASVAAILLIPDVPGIKTPKERDTLQGSPNNALGRRTNEARVNQRIPYIFGIVKSIPDLLTPTYVTYENHREVEIGYYCVGIGDFDVLASDCRDGDSLINQIPGASLHVYGQGEAPTGTGPFSGTVLAIGDPIEDPVYNVYEVRSVNGQTIDPFNSRTCYGAAKKKDIDGSYNSTASSYGQFFSIMRWEYVDANTGIVHIPFLKDPQYVFDRIEIGDKLFNFMDQALLFASSNPKPDLQTDTAEPFDNAVTVTNMTIEAEHVAVEFSVPASLAAEWALVPAYISGLLAATSVAGQFDSPYAELTSLARLFIGPFFVDFEHEIGSSNQQVIVNLLAPNGAYADDGTTIHALGVEIAIQCAPCDDLGVITGAWESVNGVVQGSDVTDGPRALTIRFTPTFFSSTQSRFLVRARRIEDRPRRAEIPNFVAAVNYPAVFPDVGGQEAYTGRIIDEVRWMNCYSVSTPPNGSFGGVTTVHTKTVAQTGSTRRSRELNMVVRRKIQTWDGVTFGGTPIADSRAENVLFTIMKDPMVGNRTNAEIDFVGIANAAAAVRAYFNDSNNGNAATNVSITFDDFNTSFQETITAIADLAFLQLYRQGNVIKAKADIETDIAVCAFNHRNIVPGSQKISHTWGPPTENDSVEVDYVDPFDNSIGTVTVPTIGSFVSPRTVKVVGIQLEQQAYWHAYRAYMKMKHQRQALEMQCTQEAGLLVVKDRVLVADITKLNKLNGEIKRVSGLNIRLSQEHGMDPFSNYTIFLQMPSGTVEGIPVTPGSGLFDAVLGSAPSDPLITDRNDGVPTIYTIVKDDEAMAYAYLVSEQTAESNMLFNVSGINYSHMYYFGDGLNCWVERTLVDQSPKQFSFIVDHSIPIFNQPGRGNMLEFDGTNGFEVDPARFTDVLNLTRGYTIACWVVHDSTPSFGFSGLCNTTDDATLLFGFFDNDLAAGHNNTLSVQAACPTGSLHHVAVTWDPGPGRLAIFIDGRLVDSATGVAAPTTPLGHSYCNQFDGLMDNMMRWKRTLSDRAIMELYLKTKS